MEKVNSVKYVSFDGKEFLSEKDCEDYEKKEASKRFFAVWHRPDLTEGIGFTMILLGNLSIKEIESRSGVTFPKELVDYMEPRRQQEASEIKSGYWHCFDVPFNLVCGDRETATEIYKHLSPLSSKFKEKMNISLQ